MDGYDDLDLLIDDFGNDLVDVFVNDVAPSVEDVVNKKSQGIYNMYDNTFPNRYEQKKAGSFGDVNVIHSEIITNSNGIEIEVTNDSKGSLYDIGDYLDEIIESGDGYQFSRETVPARPVYEPALEEIEETQLIERILENKLKQKGYDFK